MTDAKMGFFPMVKGEEVNLTQGGAMSASSEGDFNLTMGGAQWARVSGDMTVHQGGVQTLLSRGDVSVSQGGILVSASRSTRVDGGTVGFLLAGDAELNDCKVLFGKEHALMFGAVAGVVFAVVSRLLRGRR